MQKIAVIGVGSGGIQAICHMLVWLKDVEIYSVYDPKIDIVGIGESTNPGFVSIIQDALDFDLRYDMPDLDATLKFGTEYIDWRPTRFMNPLLDAGVAIHFNTFKFKEFAFPRLKNKWAGKFFEIQGTVTNIQNVTVNNIAKAKVTIDGDEHLFDWVIDCTGFPKQLTDENYVILHDHPVNHCLVHNKIGGDDWRSTRHRATIDGWQFELPLATRCSFGYLFNNKITSKDVAKQNFANLINVDIAELDNIEYVFTAYHKRKIFDGRIFTNGNGSAFFEPMFANSLWIYNNLNRLFTQLFYSATSETEQILNNQAKFLFEQILAMMYLNYHRGSVHDTEFWNNAKKVTNNSLLQAHLDRTTPALRDMHRRQYRSSEPQWVYNGKNLLHVMKNFGYYEYLE